MSYDTKNLSEKIRRSIEILMEEKETDTGKRIFNKNIANELNITESNYSKKLSGDNILSVEELVTIANYFGVTCDRILTGQEDENIILYKNAPLNNLSLDWVNEASKDCPECIELLNIILGDRKKHIAERLLKIILYYCYSDIFKISSVMGETPINADSSSKMLKSLALNDFSYLLDDISEIWNKKQEKPDTALEKAFRTKNGFPPESKRRLRIKAKTQRKLKIGNADAVEFINLVENLSE